MPAGFTTDAVRIVDQDGAGTDILVGAWSATQCRIYRQSPAAYAFGTLVDSWAGTALTDFVVDDLDGAWPLDLASIHDGNSVRVRRFPSGLQSLALPAAFSAQKIETIDIDNDGDRDLVIAGWGNANVYYAINTGGVFGAPTTHPALTTGTSRPQCFAVGDFNHDGQSDLIVPMASGDVRYMRNTTAGAIVSFAAPQTYANPNTRPWDVCVDDFNGDGLLDFATANSIGTVSIWLNNGTSSPTWTSVGFSLSTVTLGSPNVFPSSIGSCDTDCDGDRDLFVTLRGMNQVVLLRNSGAGVFTPSTTWATGTGPMDLAIGDLDDDLDCDVATANLDSPTGSSTRIHMFGGTHQKHFYVGGISDGFNTTVPATVEDACPRPGAFTTYCTPRRDFDQASCARKFGHTFPNVSAGLTFPNNIVSARLSVRFRGNCAAANDDSFGIAFMGSPARMIFESKLVDMASVPSTYGAATTAGMNLDLANLPGGIDLLPWMNATKSLDIFFEDGTEVDSIMLELITCTRVLCEFSQKQTDLVAGTNWTIAAGGAPPGGWIFFFIAPTVGSGPILPGGMFSLVSPSFLTVVAAPAGSASVTIPLPPTLPGPCVTLSTQSIAWPSWCYSNTWTAQFFN
ncbi:MAG: VCBS repeat-containing protein [Planctomycetes bacterium]|nr:VCBS repeat-containing protein [Planctomycetota bacterium]